MLVAQQTIQESGNVRAAVLVMAVCVIVFWRTALRVLLVAVVVAALVGATVLLHGIQ